MKKSVIIFTVIIVFLSSLLRVTPIFYKGYSPAAMYENLVLARNLALHNVYKIEDEKNVFLSSTRVVEEGIESALPNKLTPLLYGQIFKIFGLNLNMPIYVSVLFFAFSSVLLFLLVLKLFGYWPAVLFSLFDLFMPVIWKGAVMPGFYEFAVFFFAAGLLIYFWRREANYFLLIFSGIFLGLAVLSRNAFLISLPPLLAYEFYQNKSYKKLLVLALPIILIIGGFFLADVFRGNFNYYLSKQFGSFTIYGHLFPDPYTFHFERNGFLKDIQNVNDPDISEFLIKYGYSVSLKNRLSMYWHSTIFYPIKLFATTIFAGSISVFLMALGAAYLYRARKDLFKYFLWFWLPFWYLMLVLLKTNNWDHFLEIRFPLILMMTMGVYWLITRLLTSRWLIILLILAVFFQIFSAARWMFHETYESSLLTQRPGLIQEIKQAGLTDKDVIAVGFHPTAPELLNYYTDKNYIYFAPQTIEKLVEENKLKEAFGKFNVNYFLSIKNDANVSLEKLFK